MIWVRIKLQFFIFIWWFKSNFDFLGHGPYSHLWESFIAESGNQKYHHEDTSIAMFDKLLDDAKLRPTLKHLADIDETDIIFIKELIVGPLDDEGKRPNPDKSPNDEEWPYRGRPEEKSFLYEIVANKSSGKYLLTCITN